MTPMPGSVGGAAIQTLETAPAVCFLTTFGKIHWHVLFNRQSCLSYRFIRFSLVVSLVYKQLSQHS